MNERKRAILWLDDRHVFDIFAGAFHHAFVSLPVLEGLPADVKLLQVTHSWERRAFGFMLASESFAEVPDGEFAPDLGPATKYQVVKLLRAEGHPEDSADCPAYVVPRELR